MDLGVVVGGDLRSLPGLAGAAERAGFESVWVAETARSAFVQAAVVCGATSRIRVGTDIALAFPRSPTITAMTARDLAELSDGRFILGLGSQVKRVNEQRFGIPFEHPAPKIAEGVLGHPMTSPRYVKEVLRPAVRRGAEAAGRDPSEVNVSTGVILQVSD